MADKTAERATARHADFNLRGRMFFDGWSADDELYTPEEPPPEPVRLIESHEVGGVTVQVWAGPAAGNGGFLA